MSSATPTPAGARRRDRPVVSAAPVGGGAAGAAGRVDRARRPVLGVSAVPGRSRRWISRPGLARRVRQLVFDPEHRAARLTAAADRAVRRAAGPARAGDHRRRGGGRAGRPRRDRRGAAAGQHQSGGGVGGHGGRRLGDGRVLDRPQRLAAGAAERQRSRSPAWCWPISGWRCSTTSSRACCAIPPA